MSPGIPEATLFEGVRTLADPDGRAPVIFRDGAVADPAAPGAAPERRVRGDGRWLLPGWIDLQVNDLEWLSGGLRAPEAHARRIERVALHQAGGGVTGLVLATLAAPEEEVVAYLRGARLALDGPGAAAEVFLGVLVEGTFMNPAFHGAHNPDHVRPPEIPLLDRLLATGGARMVNVAPEMSPEALAVIRRARERGALVGCGHAKPSGLRTREAVESGLSYIIHLGNGPTGSSLKGFFEGGLLEEALRNDRLTVTLILDGVHLDPRLVRDIIARKDLSRVVGVSDAGFALGAPRGEFTAYGIRGEAAAGGRYLRVLPKPGAPPPNPLSSDAAVLFGSTAAQRDVFENCLNWLSVDMEGIYHRRHPAMPFEEALRAASAICAENPARLLGEAGRGNLSTGARGDAVLASIGGGPGSYRVTVEGVWVGGRAVKELVNREQKTANGE